MNSVNSHATAEEEGNSVGMGVWFQVKKTKTYGVIITYFYVESCCNS